MRREDQPLETGGHGQGQGQADQGQGQGQADQGQGQNENQDQNAMQIRMPGKCITLSDSLCSGCLPMS